MEERGSLREVPRSRRLRGRWSRRSIPQSGSGSTPDRTANPVSRRQRPLPPPPRNPGYCLPARRIHPRATPNRHPPGHSGALRPSTHPGTRGARFRRSARGPNLIRLRPCSRSLALLGLRARRISLRGRRHHSDWHLPPSALRSRPDPGRLHPRDRIEPRALGGTLQRPDQRPGHQGPIPVLVLLIQ